MARIRTIKPEFFTSANILSLTPLARLFYVSLWCEADREGLLNWNPETLKYRYLPKDQVSIDDLADELVSQGLIVLMVGTDGRDYASIPSFKSHQVINNRESESILASRVKGASPRVQGEGKEGREGKGREDLEPDGSVTSGKEPPEDALRCPVGEIVNAYHDNMPLNPKVKVLNDARKKTIAARWREAARLNAGPFGYASQADGITAWRDFFAICAESKFLTGQAAPQAGKPPFLADLDFLLSPAGFAKALENKYHRDA